MTAASRKPPASASQRAPDTAAGIARDLIRKNLGPAELEKAFAAALTTAAERAALLAGHVEFDLAGQRGTIRVTHRGDHVEVNALDGRIVIRPSVSNVIDVTTDPKVAS